MYFHSLVVVLYYNGKKLSFPVNLHGIQCLAVVDFATCKQLIKLIHMSIEPEVISIEVNKTLMK